MTYPWDKGTNWNYRLTRNQIRYFEHNLKKKISSFEDIPNYVKECFTDESIKYIKEIYKPSEDVIQLMESNKIKELKEIAKKNCVDEFALTKKNYKKSWAIAIINTKKFAFNAFVVCMNKNKKNVLYQQIDVFTIIAKHFYQ